MTLIFALLDFNMALNQVCNDANQHSIQYSPVHACLSVLGLFLDFGDLLLYHTIKYEWVDRHYVKIPCSWVPNTHFVKHNHR